MAMENLLLFLVAAVALQTATAGRPLPPSYLQCENNLVGLSRDRLSELSRQLVFATDNARPSFSWSVSHSARGARYTASRVLVATDASLDALLWDSGAVLGDAAGVRYAGPALRSGTLYFWKVSWRDGEGRWSEWSEETGHFLTGVLRAKDWEKAKWIAAPSTITNAPLIWKQITVGSQVTNAVLHISGLGFFKVYVNGIDLNSRSEPPIALTPGWNNYEVRVPYTTYDVTDEVKQSSTVTVEVVLGIGWRNPVDYPAGDPLPHPDDVPRVVRAMMNVTYTNKSIASFATDSTWTAMQTAFTHDSIYNGETFDSTKVRSNVKVPAVVTKGPAGVMYNPYIPPMAEMGVEKAVNIYHLQSDSDKQIVDFGNNSAGVCEINVKDLKAGASISLHHAEVPLHPPYGPMNGSLYYGNLRAAEQTDTFVSNGSLATYQPSLTYHGFRYVEVSGYPRDLTAADITKKLIYSNLQMNGHLQTSNPLLNAIQESCVRGQKSNLMSVPTDCCQRDERLGWMGDAGLSADSMALNFHTEAFLPHFVRLIADELINGSLPDVVPFY